MSKLQELINDNQQYWWWIPKNDKINLPEESIVEGILNYGNDKDVKALIDALGIKKTAAIFSKTSSRERNNYFPIIKNYFTLYFKKHAPQHS